MIAGHISTEIADCRRADGLADRIRRPTESGRRHASSDELSMAGAGDVQKGSDRRALALMVGRSLSACQDGVNPEEAEQIMNVGVMVTTYNHRDWDRLLAGDYGRAPDTPDAELIDETLKLGDMVEPLGYDSIWSTEHYGSAYSMQANPLQWLAFWAGRTDRVDMGSAVVVAPWWQPAKLVHEIAMLDLLLEGRTFHMGIGRGVSAHEYRNFGIPLEESRVRFREMIEILKLADTQERFSYDGEIYHLPEMSVRPKARHHGSLTTNIKAAFATPESMVAAADLGLGQLFVASESVEQMRLQVGKFNAIRATRGLPPNQPTTLLNLHCSTDPAELEEGKRYAKQQWWAARNHYAVWNSTDFSKVKGYERYSSILSQKDDIKESDGFGANPADLIGTPDELYETITKLQQGISLEYLIVHPAHGGKPGKAARDSLELFAKEVLPAVHDLATPLHEHSKGSPELVDADVAVSYTVPAP
jgi:alkanesulfonate monooxygenase SsuD/methylene tetrahydromethanopterin reductase-like flavin-dependent oxidoreductase (luciferase family)